MLVRVIRSCFQGCFYAIKDFINKYSNFYIGIGGGVVINQVVCIDRL